MTSEEKEQTRFFHAVVGILRNQIYERGQQGRLPKEYGDFHYPLLDCYDGSCNRSGPTPTGLVTRECNWRDVRKLITTFFRTGPDIDDDWKRTARTIGYVPEDFHDLLLGVFMGSDAPQSQSIFNRRFFNTQNKVPPHLYIPRDYLKRSS